ncbi:hypothetical protein EZV62_015067 [Acer yangbiense]|uniref:HAT C-terminal dimerisation domain-containing protein n=1 Tax=Acer yangbiense TaxID=1000413 RepID=A0A5C7HUM9_9ROSI|nr:hypothetical protein EZV62_015067 [Acer yangbiense]
MALKNVLLIILAFTCFIASGTATSRSSRNIVNLHIKPGSNLQVRLETSGGLAECWTALMELKSCTNEIVLFFLNGQANIGPDCCRAIDQLENYIADMRSSIEFSELNGLTELAQKMVENKKDKVFPLVYLLLTLALLLPVATATVERVFSAMNIVKTDLRNRMGDEWLNDSLLAYVEKDIFDTIDKETIMQRFQNMKSCRGKL